jgi:hypothetical protein
MHGMSCANLILIRRFRGQPAGLLPLHRESLDSLETALTMRPDDPKLRSDLGECWERYAEDLERANEYAGAIVAHVRAMPHELAASLAMPNETAHRDRLARHLIRSAELIIRILTAVSIRF